MCGNNLFFKFPSTQLSMNNIYLTIPGLYGSDGHHWQTIWENQYPHFQRVQQRNWDAPVAGEWMAQLEETVAANAHRHIYLVAHSMGCHTVAQWAAQTRQRVAGALLVAPPDVLRLERNGLVSGFARLHTQPLPFGSTVVASTNDPYATPEQSQMMAQQWGSRFVSIGQAGHINSASHVGHWADGFELLKSLGETLQVKRSA